jgi:hypothetical protein
VTEFLFGALAFLALLGWGITNALTARNHFREAQGLEILERVNARIDKSVTEIIERYNQIMAAKKAKAEGVAGKTVLTDEEEWEREKARQKLNLNAMPDFDEGSETILTEMPVE